MISFSMKCLKPPFSICSSLEAQKANFAHVTCCKNRPRKVQHNLGFPATIPAGRWDFPPHKSKKAECDWISANVRLQRGVSCCEHVPERLWVGQKATMFKSKRCDEAATSSGRGLMVFFPNLETTLLMSWTWHQTKLHFKQLHCAEGP